MAILIDMPMPHDCGECVFMVDGWCYCIKAEDWQSREIEFEDRPGWCPLREVVRCKDCKRYESDGGALMTCTLNDMITDDDCFCWWGERREE